MGEVAIGLQNRRRVYLSAPQRETHMHVIGASGTGKTSFLEHLIRQDILTGDGVFVLDPHGTLYERLVRWIGFHDIQDIRTVHLINPAEEAWTVGFNPLCGASREPTDRVDAMVDAIMKVWRANESDTPRLSKCLQLVCYALAEKRQSLLQADQFSYQAERAERTLETENLENEIMRKAWREFSGYSKRDIAQYFESFNSRLLRLVSKPAIARMMGQTDQVLDLRTCMEQRHIVLVNLAQQPGLSLTTGSMIGAMMFADLYQSALARDEDEAKRNPFYAYIDECARYLTDDIANSLDETRKFGLHYVLSHQRMNQLKRAGDDIHDAVMDQAQTKVVFRLNREETAEEMSRHLFRQTFDLERLKEKVTMPVTVGQKMLWLDSYGGATTHTHGVAVGEATTHTESEAETFSDGASVFIPDDGDALGVTVSEAAALVSGTSSSHSLSAVESSSVSEGRTWGRQQTLAADIRERPVHLYRLDEMVHEGMVALRSLPNRHAFVYSPDGTNPFRIVTEDVVSVPHLDSFVGRVTRAIADRSQFTRQIVAPEPKTEEMIELDFDDEDGSFRWSPDDG